MNITRLIIATVVGVLIFGSVILFTRFVSSQIENAIANRPKAVNSVTVEDIKRERWPITVPAVGSLRAINGVDVSAEVSGQVRQIEFQSGDHVEEGQLLVQLDVQEEMSRLASARATEKLAGITAQRAERLLTTRAGTQANVDDAVAQLDIARASTAQIEALISKKTILAPFDGELGVRQVDLGEYVAPGQVMVNVQDLSAIFSDFTVSQRQIALLDVGATLHMTVDAWPGRVFEGRITAIAPLVDARTGMISVEGRFDNPIDPETGRRPLRPGMLARVEAVQPQVNEVMTLPVMAVTYQLSGDTVFVLEPLEDEDRQRAEEQRAATLETARTQADDLRKQADREDDAQKAAQLRRRADRVVEMAEKAPYAQFQVRRVQIVVGQRQKDRVTVESDKDRVAVEEGLKGDETIVTSGQMKLETGSLVWISDTKLVPTSANSEGGATRPNEQD